MSRYIDAEGLKLTFCAECSHTIKCEDCDIDYHFEHYPTADVVEVVRCKDCRYWQDNQEGHYPNELCPWDKNETTDEDDYCSFGERRKDAT